MKANITKKGVLTIYAENEIEAYALDNWCNEKIKWSGFDQATQSKSLIISVKDILINTSLNYDD